MGIKGLWREVSPVCRAGHISQFRGLRVGVDTYCWLHRAVIACAVELAMDTPCEKYIGFMSSRVDLLLRYGVTPVLIFDGDAMPMKRGTDSERKARREQALREGRSLMEAGAVDDAARCFEKSLEVTTEIAYSVIQVMQDRGIECIVAPYEADAQLGYLAKEGYISAVISEDSDLIVYHCCTLLAKMDHNGNCDCLHIRDLPNVPLLSTLSYESFVVACIMSGCDYLPSLPHVGIKTALKLAGSSKSIPLLMAALSSQLNVPAREIQPYEEMLHKAYYCFAHHLVYDPVRREVVPFRPFPLSVAHRPDLVGPIWDPAVAEKVCLTCEWDPSTLQPYTNRHRQNVELHWRRVKKGQTSLTSFSGFERMRSLRVVAHASQDTTPATMHASRRLADSPLVSQLPSTASLSPRGDSAAVVPWGVLGSGGSGDASSRVVVTSRYFTSSRAQRGAVISSSSDSDDTSTDDECGDTAVGAKRCDSDAATTSPSSTAASVLPDDARLNSFSSPPVPSCGVGDGARGTLSSQRGGLGEVVSSVVSPPAKPVVLVARTKCPYGYPQCGAVHSVFFKCFQGKNWTKGDSTTTTPLSVPPPLVPTGTSDASAVLLNKRPREEVESSSVDDERRRIASPLASPLSPTVPQPSSAVCRRLPVARAENLRAALGTVASASTNTPTVAAAVAPPVAPVMSSASSSTKAAAAIFEKLAFRR